MKRIVTLLVLLLVVLCPYQLVVAQQQTIYLELMPENANKDSGLLPGKSNEFVPASKETTSIEFAVGTDALVTLKIYSADGDLIRTLSDSNEYNSGRHAIVWDGKDNEGIVVPNEAYTPVFTAKSADSIVVDDPRRYSGGEIITRFDWTLRGKTEISYDMPYSARVLARAGIENGPMMRELLHWEPVSAGKAVIRWDGFDAKGVEKFAEREDVWFVIMAYRLPEYAIISSGNTEMDYREYRQMKGWPTPVPDMAKIELQRSGVRLEQDYFMPRAYLPRVSLGFAENVEMSRFGLPLVSGRVKLKIDVPEEDRWILDSSFYETGFYIDYQFQSEEEQGFVPLIWDYDTSQLEAGRHIATVQLFGFGGFISSDTVEFLVKP